MEDQSQDADSNKRFDHPFLQACMIQDLRMSSPVWLNMGGFRKISEMGRHVDKLERDIKEEDRQRQTHEAKLHWNRTRDETFQNMHRNVHE